MSEMSSSATATAAPATGGDEDAGDWEYEDSAHGPQGVFVRAEDVYPGGVVQTVTPLAQDEEVFESPEARAQERFDRLATTFSTTLALVAQMYRDEDWRYLRKDDGSPYQSLVEVCQVALGKSVSMARRYVQGARDVYLPLSEVMVDGTRLEIRSSDIAALGTEGLKSVVDDATGRLDGVDDPDEATGIVNEAISEARARTEAEREAPGQQADPGSSSAGERPGREFDEAPDPDAVGPVETYTEGADEWPSDAPVSQTGGDGPPGSSDDLIAPLLTDAPLYREGSPELGRLPDPVNRVVQAMLVLETADVAEIAHTLDYESRGIIVHGDRAMMALERIRAMAETQPWVMQRLGDS